MSRFPVDVGQQLPSAPVALETEDEVMLFSSLGGKQQESSDMFSNANTNTADDSPESLLQSFQSPSSFDPSRPMFTYEKPRNESNSSSSSKEQSQEKSPLEPEQRTKGNKRRRRPLNCSFCRSRKLKCNRQLPCSNCIRKHQAEHCSYVSNDGGEIHGEAPISQPKLYMGKAINKSEPPITINSLFNSEKRNSGNPNDVKKRLDQMETLILSILREDKDDKDPEIMKTLRKQALAGGDQTDVANDDLPDSAEDEIMRIGNSLGMMKLDRKGKSVYMGSTHWANLMADVSEVQEFFSRLRTVVAANNISSGAAKTDDICFPPEDTRAISHAAIPFTDSAPPAASAQDILSLLPGRAECDILIQRYLASIQPIVPVLHQPSFYEAYERFWEDPLHTELVFVALLFGVLNLAIRSYTTSEVPAVFVGKTNDLAIKWVQALETCSSLARVTVKPSLIHMRVLILWLMVLSGTFSSKEAAERTWVAMGTIVRTAQCMGLHRDAKWFSLSPFESQERRRLWALVQYFDVFLSISQGIPTGIKSNEHDVAEPKNINESDISQNSVNIPRAHGLAVPTTSSFLICRTKLARQVNAVLAYHFAVSKKSYDQTQKFDIQLREAYNSIPIFLRTKAHMSLPNEPAELVLQRLLLELEYLKGLVVLHRSFSGSEDPRSKYSENESILASVTMIERCKWIFSSPDVVSVREQFHAMLVMGATPMFFHATISVVIHLLKNYDSMPKSEGDSRFDLVRSAIPAFQLASAGMDADNWQPVMLSVLVTQVEDRLKLSREERTARNATRNQSRILDMVGYPSEVSVENLDRPSPMEDTSPAGTLASTAGGSSTSNGHSGESEVYPTPDMMLFGEEDLMRGVSDVVGVEEWDQLMKTVGEQWESEK